MGDRLDGGSGVCQVPGALVNEEARTVNKASIYGHYLARQVMGKNKIRTTTDQMICFSLSSSLQTV